MDKLDHEGLLSYWGLVLQTKKRVRLVAGGVRGLQESVQRKGNENIRRLVGELQQPGHRPLPGGNGENEKVLFRIGC